MKYFLSAIMLMVCGTANAQIGYGSSHVPPGQYQEISNYDWNKPREWFSVPLDTARDVVRRIIDGSIVQYRMDNTTNRLIKKTI